MAALLAPSRASRKYRRTSLQSRLARHVADSRTIPRPASLGEGQIRLEIAAKRGAPRVVIEQDEGGEVGCHAFAARSDVSVTTLATLATLAFG